MTAEINIDPDAIGRDFWRTLDKLRQQEGVSLNELADRVGMTRSCLQKRRERQTGFERLSEVAKLFAAIGCHVKIVVENDA